MEIALYLCKPLLILAILSIWVWCVVDALRTPRHLAWIAAVVFVPPISTPLYLLNFKVFGGPTGAGLIDRYVAYTLTSRTLERDARERNVPGTWRELAHLHFTAEEYGEALEAQKKALDLEPEDLRTQFEAGVTMLLLGRAREALPHLQYVIDEDRKYAFGEALTTWGEVQHQLGKPDEALRAWDAVLEDFNVPEAAVRRAEMLAARGDFGAARATLESMLDRVDVIIPETRLRQRRWIYKGRKQLKQWSK